MKELGDFEAGGKQFSLAQGEMEGQVVNQTSAVVLWPTSLPGPELKGRGMVADLRQLHTDTPELVLLSFPGDTSDLHDEELQAAILAEGARKWREHYDPADFPDVQEPEPAGESNGDAAPRWDAWTWLRGLPCIIRWPVMYWPFAAVVVAAYLMLPHRPEMWWASPLVVFAGLAVVGVYGVTVLPAIGRALNRARARALLPVLVEHRRSLAVVKEHLELVNLTAAGVWEVLTRDHIRAMLNRYENGLRRVGSWDADVTESELRAWACLIEDLNMAGRYETGPIRYESGYTNAIGVVMSSLTNDLDPWYDLTEEGIAGMRRYLDIADTVHDGDDFDSGALAEWNRNLDLKTAARFQWFKGGPFHLCVYAEPAELKFGLIGLSFPEASGSIEDVMIAEFTVDEAGAVLDLDLRTADPRAPETQVREWLGSIREQLATMTAVQRL